MRNLWVDLLFAANELFPLSPNLREVDSAKHSVAGYQEWERQELVKIAASFGAAWDLAGQDVLDVGCGLGGKSSDYLAAGARAVVGIDLRSFSLHSAARSEPGDSLPAAASQAAFCQTDAARMPFADNSFDVIVSINVLEHVDDLYAVLRECKRVLRPNGRMLFHFPPFYSPWGAHLEGWIAIPWLHLFFPDRILLQTAHRIELARSRNSDYIPTAQVRWDQLDRLPELNRVTVQQFRHLLAALEMEAVKLEMLPVGYYYLARRGSIHRLLLGLLQKMARMPLLCEVIATKMSWVLRPGKTAEGRAQ